MVVGGESFFSFIHRIAESNNSRKLGFRYVRFSETELPIFSVLGNSEGRKAQKERRGVETPPLYSSPFRCPFRGTKSLDPYLLIPLPGGGDLPASVQAGVSNGAFALQLSAAPGAGCPLNANAGIAVAIIIAAMSAATDNTKSKRLMRYLL